MCKCASQADLTHFSELPVGGNHFHHERAKSPAARKHRWLAIKLITTKSNRDGNGAAIKFTAGNLATYDQAKGGMSF